MIPLFKSTFSLKSILTLEKPDRLLKKEEISDYDADSIFDIADKNGLKTIYLLENTMIGFKKAHELSKELGIQLIFGVIFNVCNDRKDEDKKSSAHKLNIFARNDEGCKELMKLYSLAHTESEGFLDCDTLKERWTENLFLAVPFYDSFIHRNAMYFQNCIPDLSFTTPTMFVEDNDLPFDHVLAAKTKKFAAQNNWPIQAAKTIYYKNRVDVEPYIVYKIATNRQGGRAQTLDRPELGGLSSCEFCWQSYHEKSLGDRNS